MRAIVAVVERGANFHALKQYDLLFLSISLRVRDKSRLALQDNRMIYDFFGRMS